jgi:hypothetical protein
MTSRIWVDKSGADGVQIADQLRQLGFIVEEFLPDRAPSDKHMCRFSQAVHQQREGTIPHAQSFDETPQPSNNYRSLAAKNSQPACEEVVRLWKKWQRCPQCFPV